MKRHEELERDLEDEIRFHLEKRTEANIRSGIIPEEARLEAEGNFGDPEAVRKAGRKYLRGATGEAHWFEANAEIRKGKASVFRRLVGFMGSLRQDLALGVRTLVRSPFLAATAVISLALGIGANTANFSIVYGILLRDLPSGTGEDSCSWTPGTRKGEMAMHP